MTLMMLHCEIRCFLKRSFSVERRKNRIAGSLVSFSKPRSKSFKGSIRRKSFCYSRVTKNCRDEKKARNKKCVWKHLSEGNPEVTHGTNVIFQYFPIRPAVLGIIFRTGCILQVTPLFRIPVSYKCVPPTCQCYPTWCWHSWHLTL